MREPVPRNGHVTRASLDAPDDVASRDPALDAAIDRLAESERAAVARDAQHPDHADLRESDAEAPWTPLPLERARAFARDNDAQIEVYFPTVYEEDRTAKIADLTTAQTLGAVSHHRMSDSIARELGIENYDYDEELQQIEMETKRGVGVPRDAGLPETDALDDEPRRADVSNDATHEFRKQQRSVKSEAEHQPPFRSLSARAEIAALRQELSALREALTVTDKTVTRDSKGQIVKITERRVPPVPDATA